MARLLNLTGESNLALDQLLRLARLAPQALPLAARPMAELALALDRVPEAQGVLSEAERLTPSVDHVEALAMLVTAGDTDAKATLFLQHLSREPSLVVAAGWLALDASPLPREVVAAVNKATVPLRRYRCAACGFEAGTHFWQCPGCQTWDSYSPRRVDEL
jgi:lipopolysaccharide biosynthesis regulator YciM